MTAVAAPRSWCLFLSLACWFVQSAVVGAQSGAESAPSETAAARQYAAAVALQNREVYDLAAEEWTKFLEQFASDSRANHARHYRAVCLLKLDKLEEAAASFRQLTLEAPQFPLIESAYLHLGITEYRIARSGKTEFYDRALETLAELIRKFPDGKHLEQALFYRGECLYALGKKTDAIKHYAKLVEDYPNGELTADALYALAVTQQELNQNDEARRTLTRYLKRFPETALAAEVTLRLGETLFAAGEFDQAARQFAKVADTEGFDLADQAILRHAACLFEQGDFANAAARYAELPRRFPNSPHADTARLSAGKSAYLAGNTSDARKHLEPLLRDGSDEKIEATHWAARSWLKESQPAAALKVVEAALPVAGTGPLALELEMDRADALFEIRERREEAMAAYARVAAEHPEAEVAPQALYMASFAALAEGEHAQALRDARAFLERYTESPLKSDVGYVAAEASLQLGKLDDAEARYRELVENFSDRAEVDRWRLRLSAVLHLRGKHREVVAVLTPLASKLNEPQAQAEAFYLLGSSQSRLGDFESAARHLEASLKAAPGSSRSEESLLALADTYRRLNRTDAAKARLEKLLVEHPGGRLADHAQYQLAEMAADEMDYEVAARRYRAIIESSPEGALAPGALAGLGWAELNRGEHAEAVSVLNELIRKYPDDAGVPRARYARAVANYQLKEYAAAIDDLKPLVLSELPLEELSDARYVLGLCQSELEEHAAAAELFRQLLDQNEDYEKADHVYYEMAWALKSLGREHDAARAFGRLAEKHKDSPLLAESLYHLGEYFYGEQQYDRAASSYYASMRKAGKSDLGEKAAHKLGWSYFRQDLYDKALGTLRFQRTSWPEGALAADAAFVEAECLFKQSKYNEALMAYAEVRSPSSEQFAALALLHGGQSAAQLKAWQQSADLLAGFLERFAESPYADEALYERAWALQNLGQMDEALEGYENVTAANEGELAARARFMIGEIHFQRKEHDLAVRSFFKVAYGYAYPKWQAAAHYEAGRCFEVLGKLGQARKSYQEIIDKFPESEQATMAQERLREFAQ